MLDPTAFEFSKKYINEWNVHIKSLAEDGKVVKALEQIFESHFSIESLKLLIFQLVVKLTESHNTIRPNDVIKLCDSLARDDDTVTLMKGLSVLEITILITIKHHCDIYDNDPFNFEMIFTRFNKFAIKSTTMQSIEREMVLKRFENLKYQEFIVPTCAEGKVQKEYQMYKMTVLPDQIDKAIQSYQNLPTEIDQWAKSSLI